MGKFDPAPTVAAGLIRLARERAGLTQTQLAARAKVTQQTVSAYETGRKEPTLPTLAALVEAAGYEIRFRLEPKDDHDQTVQQYLETLPPPVRAEVEKARRERVETARLDRVRGR